MSRLEKFLATIDGLAMGGGLDPLRHASAIHDSWTRARGEHWARLGVLSAQMPPSDDERRAILRELRERAARSAA